MYIYIYIAAFHRGSAVAIAARRDPPTSPPPSSARRCWSAQTLVTLSDIMPLTPRGKDGLPGNMMARSTSDCGRMRCLQHEMAQITSDCGRCQTAGDHPRPGRPALHPPGVCVLRGGHQHRAIAGAPALHRPGEIWNFARQHENGPSHLGLRMNARTEHEMARTTPQAASFVDLLKAALPQALALAAADDIRLRRECLCLVFPLRSWLRSCLCLVLPSRSWLTHRLCLACSHCLRD